MAEKRDLKSWAWREKGHSDRRYLVARLGSGGSDYFLKESSAARWGKRPGKPPTS